MLSTLRAATAGALVFSSSVDLACAQDTRPAAVALDIRSIVQDSGGLARSETIGTSRGSRPIELVTLATGTTDELEDRPGILVVAGADGRRRLGSALALSQCQQLVNGAQTEGSPEAKLLADFVIYVVPTLNPDGAALGRHGNAASLDLDRDGASDEDGADDLNGDDLITSMRWQAPGGEWLLDDDEPRLMRKADADKGERGTHHLAIEALDTDGDEERSEDDGQGVWIDRTFPHRYAEFDRRTGPFPMSEPETRALADFVYAHRNIVLAFVWGRDDTLLETPKVKEPKPRVHNEGILEGDKGLFEKVGKLYREKTVREGDGAARLDGSPWSWLYLQVGVPTFATDLWRPAKLEEEEKKDPLRDARRRLAACEAAGRGFEPWTPFEHPELGAVEVGGFVREPLTRLLPAEERDALFVAHHEFFLEACSWRPELRIESFEVEPLAGGAFKLEAFVVNDGSLAALTATGERTRRFSVPRLVLKADDNTLLAGRTRTRVRNLDAFGGRQEFTWIVAGKPGDSVRLQLLVDPVGGDEKEIQL